jgi:hypothetical protein
MIIHFRKFFLIFLLLLGLSTEVPPPKSGQTPVPKTAESCGANSQITNLLNLTTADDWSGWIARLSGLDPILLDGETTSIETRYSYAMFRGDDRARGYEYVLTRLYGWFPRDQIEEDTYSPDSGVLWKNIVLTLPGEKLPDESVILSAHLDSTSDDAEFHAPGAEDNATGSAALLEAARIFRTHRFARTLKIIWFTGEEQGLLGSKAYVRDHELTGITGVINLDMFGYDPNKDGCFELHIGTLKASQPIGTCFRTAANAYSPTLKVDAIDSYNMRFSDHNSFWQEGIGAVLVLENFSSGQTADACGGLGEPSPYYHKTTDTLNRISIKTGFDITRSGLATTASMANPVESCFKMSPRLTVLKDTRRATLSWTRVQGASRYRIFRSDGSTSGQTPLCSAEWIPIFETNAMKWVDTSIKAGEQYAYRVEALSPTGTCVSHPSACTIAKDKAHSHLFPWINH